MAQTNSIATFQCLHCGSWHSATDRTGWCQGALSPIQSQPEPRPNQTPAVWDLVMADMEARDMLGQRQYGVRLQPHNGRDALADAYAEALDLVAYLRQAIYERDGK